MIKVLSTIMLFFISVIEINSPKTEPEIRYYHVQKVIDGDTFYISIGNNKIEKIRLIGIDAPEIHKSAHKDVGIYGQQAKAFLIALLKDKQIKLEYDVSKKDRYGRTLAYAYLPNGVFINEKLVALGYAKAATFPPNVKFSKYFVKLEREARTKNLGLWKYE
ncbi:thermonuclease family protein [Solitalea sp. MAHUQ-68]|uniref:Thermonuclease family protein n=1 Tax=Solitalea agri TaxID=2953739 RepID=A0A9X2F4A1_9SPHI|nr:thermonuclease family protein [Solitalea agri]MCO4291513.1 thermonuclease family protein [Solitalea agri]